MLGIGCALFEDCAHRRNRTFTHGVVDLGGGEVQRPLATVVIGGLVPSAVLTLVGLLAV